MAKIRADIKKSLRDTNKINMQYNKKNKKNYEKVAKEFTANKINTNFSKVDYIVLLVLSCIFSLFFIIKSFLV